MTDSVGQHRSHYQLRVVGALRLSTVVVADSFFESVTTASVSVGKCCARQNVVEKSAQTNNYIVGSRGVGQHRRRPA